MTAPFTLRAARPDDAAALDDVLYASYSTVLRGWYRDETLDIAAKAMGRANPALLSSGRYFLAEIGGRAVACGGWSREAPGRGGVIPRLAHVRHFATHPDYLGRGLGGAILARSIGEAKDDGAVEMEAISTLAAEAFYAHHGFRRMADRIMTMGGAPFAAVLMRMRM